MKKTLLIFLLCGAGLDLSSQVLNKPSACEISHLPQWAQVMYGNNPRVTLVDSLYEVYYRDHQFEKNYHTQYYKRWRRSVQPFITGDGYVDRQVPRPSASARMSATTAQGGGWVSVGPFRTMDASNYPIAEQTNVYSIDQCEANPNVMFCGTETAEIYKSTDGGMSWQCVSAGYSLYSGTTAIEIDPTNPSIVFAGNGDDILRSSDGGATWTSVLSASSLDVNEILVNPANPQLVLAATGDGLFRSVDGGLSFTPLYTDKTYDIKLRPGDPSVVYILKNNPSQIRCEFLMSTDTGATFTVQSTGWYASADPNRNDGGARLAVTPADSLRVYAYLIGEAKAGDDGYIGVYRSNDGGQTWMLPNGPDGGPYSTSHPNLAIGSPSWTYHQGFYNCAITASSTDANDILIGGLNLWRSDDGGLTFTSVAGYVGGPLSMHVDMQDFRSTASGTWITCDGGIYFSNDFYNNNADVRMDGVRGSDYWGFGQGWNEDVTIGGLYHNGNTAHYQNYPAGTNLAVGGGEPASGYVNPGENRHVASSDIGGAILPQSLGQPINWYSFGMFPNESYWAAESSEMEYDPRCYGIVYLGNENKLWRSEDAGGSFNLVHTFTNNVNNRLHQIEISRSNEDVMYVSQRPASGNTGYLYRTADGGQNWTQLTIPPSGNNSRRILLALNPENENILWIAYPSGANGSKVFRTTDGGQNWTNITTTDLNGEEVRSLVHVGGTDGGVYAFTYNSVFYRNNTLSNWIDVSSGLPALVNTDIAKPFYRDGKIRVATYGKGIWENTFQETPTHPIAQAMVDKLNYELYCETDTFRFEDHSMLNHTGASWSWSFPGGNPSSSTLRNPKVVYANPGTYQAYLTITDGQAQTDSDTLTITVSAYQLSSAVQEDYQAAFPPGGWYLETFPNGGQWTLSTAAGGYGNSTQSALFDNFNFDAQGSPSDMRIGLNLTNVSGPKLTFDVAYSNYGFPYSDTLYVMASTDCGATWTSYYVNGGNALATAPSLQSSTFVPTATQWRTDTADISALAGSANVMIAFRNMGYFGQALYIDNINLLNSNGITENKTEGSAGIFPNPAVAGTPVNFISTETGLSRISLYDASGKKIGSEMLASGQSLKLASSLAPGYYFYHIEGEKIIRNGKLLIMAGR